MPNLIDGFLKFRKDVFPAKRHLYRQLAHGQNPHALFITCSDSRIVPNLITQTDPGSLFICRTVGNQVPPHPSGSDSGVASSIEYSAEALGVKHVIICGHSDCGAMKAVMHPENISGLPATAAWLRHSASARAEIVSKFHGLPEEVLLHLLTERNIVHQLEHLKTHPAIQKRLKRGDLQLHGWLYSIASGDITTFDAQKNVFVPLDKQAHNATAQANISLLEGAA